MRILLAGLLWVVAGTCALLQTASAQGRLALLIGNQSYAGRVQALKNPHNDIKAVGTALQSVGFKVLSLPDVGRRHMLTAVKDFAAELAKGGPSAVGFLYYSGHGVARPEDGANYLIPVDLKDTTGTDFWFDAVKLDDILGELERAAPFAAHFVVFDACRDELRLPYRSASKGFEPVAERSGMFIAFATALRAVALDEGKPGSTSGPYAAVLAAELVKTGQDHLQLFQNVKEGVFAATQRRQVPWERNGLLRRVYFSGERGAAGPPDPREPQLSEAERAWGAAKDTTNIAVIEAFIARYKDTFFADLARARLEELKKQQASIADPRPPKPTGSAGRDADFALYGAQINGMLLEGLAVASAEACRASCRKNSQCVAFTFLGLAGYCNLFQNFFGVTDGETDAESGVRHAAIQPQRVQGKQLR